VNEVQYIARLTNHIRFGAVAFRKLARDAGMSDEGLTGIMEDGTEPRQETLRQLAAYAREHDPTYSALRLYVAAGWFAADDPARTCCLAAGPCTGACPLWDREGCALRTLPAGSMDLIRSIYRQFVRASAQ
jgi:hypothetical protein